MSFTHDYPFDPTAGYTPKQLLGLAVELYEPEDFVRFWQDTYQFALNRPLNWTMHPSKTHPGNEHYEVFDIAFDSLCGNGNRVGGWLTLPRGRPATRGAVCTHGYGGRDAPDIDLPLPADAACIQPVLSGLPTRSLLRQADSAPHHVLIGIDNRETYIHRFCAMDIWRAASVLQEAVPQLQEQKLDYIGGSFGGGMGAIALPWDERFGRAFLLVPSFGNHPLRLQIPCSGSGEFVRLYAQKHPRIAQEVLPYFDAALCARHIKIPVLVEAAFFDPAVTPPGQFSVYHSLGGAKQLFTSLSGHYEHSGTAEEMQRLYATATAFFR